jgi:heme exporter protein A
LILTLDRVAARRGGRWLLEEVSLTLAAGEAALVTGANGVGKSSLLRIAAGLLAPAEGRVTFAAPRALMGEASALDGERRLRAALDFWAAIDGGRERVAAAMAALDLEPLADVPVRLLSTGQRRRAALARVVASGAALWLLDEPTSGLDTASVAAVEVLVAAHRAGGGAAMIATHQPLDLPGAVALELRGAA